MAFEIESKYLSMEDKEGVPTWPGPDCSIILLHILVSSPISFSMFPEHIRLWDSACCLKSGWQGRDSYFLEQAVFICQTQLRQRVHYWIAWLSVAWVQITVCAILWDRQGTRHLCRRTTQQEGGLRMFLCVHRYVFSSSTKAVELKAIVFKRNYLFGTGCFFRIIFLVLIIML